MSHLYRVSIRQRLDPKRIDYLIDWLVESNLLVSVPWGSTSLKLDNGTVLSIPRQLIQAHQSQIVYLYKQHCTQVNVDALSDRSVYSILDSIHASNQKFVSGLDDFVQAAAEGWSKLNQVIQQLPTTSHDKNHLNCMLEKSKLYLKSKYGGHCDEDEQATTHCTVFALSQASSQFYSQSCGHAHMTYCEGTSYVKIRSINTATDCPILLVQIAY